MRLFCYNCFCIILCKF